MYLFTMCSPGQEKLYASVCQTSWRTRPLPAASRMTSPPNTGCSSSWPTWSLPLYLTLALLFPPWQLSDVVAQGRGGRDLTLSFHACSHTPWCWCCRWWCRDPRCIKTSVQWRFFACYMMLWSRTPGLVVLTIFGNSVIKYIYIFSCGCVMH